MAPDRASRSPATCSPLGWIGCAPAGLLERQTYQTRPELHEYLFTDKGRDLAPGLLMLMEWAIGTTPSVTDQPKHVMVVTDDQGLVLWRDGQRDVLRLTAGLGLAEGTRWAEDSTGTNGMGTALAATRAVEIHSAEHLVSAFDAWACAACPVRDPDSGEVIGIVDITGPVLAFNPLTLPLVEVAAQRAEEYLAKQLAR